MIRSPLDTIAANGTVNTNTEPHQKYSSKTPATSGPSAAMALPIPDHRAMDRVRPQRGDQCKSGGICHPRRQPAYNPGCDKDTGRRGADDGLAVERQRQRPAHVEVTIVVGDGFDSVARPGSSDPSGAWRSSDSHISESAVYSG